MAARLEWSWDDIPEDRRQLVLDMLPYAYRLADARANHKLPAADLRQEAAIALGRAAIRWDPERASFRTFAHHAIVGALLDAHRDSDHLPRSIRDRLGEDDLREWHWAPQSLDALLLMTDGSLDAMDLGALDPDLFDFEDRLQDRQVLDEFLAYAASQPWFTGHLPKVVPLYLSGLLMRQVGASVGLTESRISYLLRDFFLRAAEWGALHREELVS